MGETWLAKIEGDHEWTEFDSQDEAWNWAVGRGLGFGKGGSVISKSARDRARAHTVDALAQRRHPDQVDWTVPRETAATLLASAPVPLDTDTGLLGDVLAMRLVQVAHSMRLRAEDCIHIPIRSVPASPGEQEEIAAMTTPPGLDLEEARTALRDPHRQLTISRDITGLLEALQAHLPEWQRETGPISACLNVRGRPGRPGSSPA